MNGNSRLGTVCAQIKRFLSQKEKLNYLQINKKMDYMVTNVNIVEVII